MDGMSPMMPSYHLEEINAFDTRDGLYDCCWSECHPDVLVAASGDGSVKVSFEIRISLLVFLIIPNQLFNILRALRF